MRELGFVCLRCRFSLLVAPRRLPIYQSAAPRSANFSTEQSAKPNAKDDALDGLVAPEAQCSRQRSAEPTKSRRPSPPDSISSLAMFKSIVEKQSNLESQSPAESLTSSDNALLVSIAARLQATLSREDASIVDAYKFFEDVLLPQISVANGPLPPHVRDLLSHTFFPNLVAERAKDFMYSDLPSVSRITQLLVQFDILKPVLWGDLILQLVDTLWTLSTTPTDYLSIQSYETAMAQREALLFDLVGAWKVIWPQVNTAQPVSSEKKCDVAVDEPRALVSSDLGGGSNFQQKKFKRRKPGFQDAFSEQFPDHWQGMLMRPSWAALATYGLLTETRTHNRALQNKAYPFLKAMRRLLARSRLPLSKEHKETPFDGCPVVLGSLLQGFLRRAREKKPPLPSAPSSRSEANIIHREIGQAVQKRNLRALNGSWTKFWGEDAVPSKTRLGQLREMSDVFDYFIFAYMSMRQTQLSINVWNSMVKLGIPPTIKTWTSMMQGCAKANNPLGIKTVWNRLIASETQLDTPVWTARISGLVMSGDLDSGVAALREMADIWSKRDEPANKFIAVKPSIEPINAALVWLLRFDRIATVKNMLGWAVKQGISPDIYTFNTVLRPLVRAGRNQEVREILDIMHQLGIRADPATFTILLDGALADISTKKPEEQVQTATKLIHDIEATGIEMNMHIYGKMIYILLEQCPNGNGGDGAAVNAVLAHIWGRGLELSSHIYTMLAEHYFSLNPPDAAAVTALINNRRLHRNPNIDRVFWERVIKGYCQVGDTQRALEIFEKLFQSGSTITFSTLYDFLSALIHEGHITQAKRVVQAANDMVAAEESEKHGDGKSVRYWRHRFWHLADKQGLLDEGMKESFRQATGILNQE